MRIVVFGTGFVGSALVGEFSARGHEVIAVSRSGSASLPQGVVAARGDVHDGAFVAETLRGADVAVLAVAPLSAQGGIATAVAAVIPAAIDAGVRLATVGGSAMLPMEPGGPRYGDTPQFPAALHARVDVHQRAIDLLEASPKALDWFTLVPAVIFGSFAPGTRRGTYRTDRAALVSDSLGRSEIGVEDYAIAFADELENPTTRRAWLTVGY